jgi:two-component system response regulator FixJ
MNGTVMLVSTNPAAPKELESAVRDHGVDLQVFDSIEKFFEYVDPNRAACLVLDMRHPESRANGPATAARVEQVSIPVICITGSSEAESQPGQVTESAEHDMCPGLLDAVTRVLRTASATLRKRSASGEIASRLLTLTPREHQVMERVVQGYSNKLIANELGISSRTIEIHRAHVMEKTGAEGLSDLVRMAFAVGAVGAPEGTGRLEQES